MFAGADLIRIINTEPQKKPEKLPQLRKTFCLTGEKVFPDWGKMEGYIGGDGRSELCRILLPEFFRGAAFLPFEEPHEMLRILEAQILRYLFHVAGIEEKNMAWLLKRMQ